MSKRDWFCNYCEKTTLHGIQYFVMKHRSPVEKLFWILSFTCMLTISVLSLRLLINYWISSPTVMFIENTESAIREIPFPSFTICPSNQVRKWIWKKYKNTNTSFWESIKNYETIVCPSYLTMSLQNSENKDNFDYELMKRLVNICGISCSEIFQSDVKWQNTTVHNVCQYIQPTLTLLGLCYTINMMPTYQIFNDEYYKRYIDFFANYNTFNYTELSHWNLDDGYSFYSSDSINTEVFPARTGGTSVYHRSRMMLHILDSPFLKCPTHAEGGFVMMINNPTEYYSFKSRSYIVPDTYSKIQITPFVKKINKDLKWRSPEIRKCYLHNERKLSIFKLYSETNCNNECRINQTISMCGCIHFEMSFLVATTNIKICGPSNIFCTLKAIKETYKPNMQSLCNCLPTCTTVEYQILHTYHYDNWTYLKTTNLVNNNSRGATVEIVFKNPYFTAYKSASIIDWNSLISTIGGLLSLLLGINIINIFEILFLIIQTVYFYILNMFDRQ